MLSGCCITIAESKQFRTAVVQRPFLFDCIENAYTCCCHSCATRTYSHCYCAISRCTISTAICLLSSRICMAINDEAHRCAMTAHSRRLCSRRRVFDYFHLFINLLEITRFIHVVIFCFLPSNRFRQI